jgi:branched-subunit amino acid transport protein
MMMMDSVEVWIATVLLAVIVFVLRNTFLFAPASLRPRGMLERALRYAPLAALTALVAPEIFRTFLLADSFAPQTLLDARLLSALALMLAVKLTGSALVGLLAGVAVFLLL